MREWEIKPDVTRGTRQPQTPQQSSPEAGEPVSELEAAKPTRQSVPRVPRPTSRPLAPVSEGQSVTPPLAQPGTNNVAQPTQPPTADQSSRAPQTPSPQSTAPLHQPVTPPQAAPLPATPAQPMPRQSAEEALSSLIERYHNGAISREQYQRDKQLLLARINPDAVTLKRAYRAPVAAGGETEARFVRRVSFAQMAALAAIVCVCALLIVGFLWWSSPIPTAENLLQRTGSPTKIPLQS